jgi:error-prone DNA polymerase
MNREPSAVSHQFRCENNARDSYVPLWCKSNYSFLEGASHPEELVETAARLGIPAIAMTDRDGVYGAVRAHVKAKEVGQKIILGAELTVEGCPAVLIVLAQDRAGYANLCRLITKGRLRSPKGESSVTWDEVCAHASGLIALVPAENPKSQIPNPKLRSAFADRLYALCTRHLLDEDASREATIREWAARQNVPVAAGVEVLYHTPERKPVQDLLTCIRHGVTIDSAGRLIRPNAEHFLHDPASFARLFSDMPDAVARTVEVAARCTFSLSEIRYRYPSERLPDGMSSSEWLKHLTFAGAQKRYAGVVPDDIARQLEKELAIIDALDYSGYFLTMWEIVEFCRARGVLCQGRGSAANSAVCYCLGITAIDPVRMNLLFERFISKERAEPPDIDLDIQHGRREEVIAHVYKKYGRDRAAMVASVIRYRPRSAVRDVGKALGIPEETLGRISALLSHDRPVDEALVEQALGRDQGYVVRGTGYADGNSRLATDDPRLATDGHPPATSYGAAPTQSSVLSPRPSTLNPHPSTLLISLAREIQDFPRHLSIHPGGFLLGHEPVHDLVPIENGSMEGRTVVQWDKYDVEALGLFKVDLLGLGALTLLDLCFTLLKDHHNIDLDMATIRAEDPDTYAMIRKADTVGVFQIESRAQMSMLPRLEPKTFYDLVVEVSIVRPGPISGGMVHPYLRRRHGEEKVEYPHESLRSVLEKTLGVPLFQEQVMKLAVVAADYTSGEADQLRRDMAAWRQSGRIEAHHERLVSRMVRKGIAPEFAERVFEQIRGFGEYGFPESHAASFALIAYATAYLKCHFPVAFTCALLNAQPMGFYAPSTIIDDAKRHGVSVLPTDVTKSAWHCTLTASSHQPSAISHQHPASGIRHPAAHLHLSSFILQPFAVRMGLRYVGGLSERAGERIVAARGGAPFASLADFVRRTGLDRGSLDALAEAGAFDSLGIDRRQALWQAPALAHAARAPLKLSGGEHNPVFAALDSFEEVNWDYRRTGHSTRGHPLTALRPQLLALGFPASGAVRAMPNDRPVQFAGMVICRQRPGTAAGVVFMTLEDEEGVINVIIWPKVFEDHELVARTEPLVAVRGRLQVEHGVMHLIAKKLWVPPLNRPPAEVESRDFH